MTEGSVVGLNVGSGPPPPPGIFFTFPHKRTGGGSG